MGTRRSRHNKGRKLKSERDLYEIDMRAMERAERRKKKAEAKHPPMVRKVAAKATIADLPIWASSKRLPSYLSEPVKPCYSTERAPKKPREKINLKDVKGPLTPEIIERLPSMQKIEALTGRHPYDVAPLGRMPNHFSVDEEDWHSEAPRRPVIGRKHIDHTPAKSSRKLPSQLSEPATPVHRTEDHANSYGNSSYTAPTFDLSGARGRWISLNDIKSMSEQDARDAFIELRWKEGTVCIHCGWDRVYEYTSRRIFKCAKCGRQFTETTQTFFRSRKLPFKTILLALATLKNGSNAWRLKNDLDINYRTAMSFVSKVNAVMNLPPPAPLLRHNVRDTLYPYILSPAKTEGSEIVLAVNEAIPRWIPEQLRADICQDMIVAIISGELDLSDLNAKASSYIKKMYRVYPTRYGAISLDSPPPWMRDSDTPLVEMLDAETANWGNWSA